jgi:hypothetical protein
MPSRIGTIVETRRLANWIRTPIRSRFIDQLPSARETASSRKNGSDIPRLINVTPGADHRDLSAPALCCVVRQGCHRRSALPRRCLGNICRSYAMATGDFFTKLDHHNRSTYRQLISERLGL